MAEDIHSNYYEDNHIKVEGQDCKRCFIVGEMLSYEVNLSCPYCFSKRVENIVSTDDETLAEMEMGCLGLNFHVYDDGSLMLNTENEFVAAMKKHFDNPGKKRPYL